MRRIVAASASAWVALASVALPVYAAGKFDGAYEGTGNVLTGHCEHPNHPVYRVSDSHISRPFGQLRVEADVGPDGKITNGRDSIRTTTTGSITGPTLSMDIVTPGCSFHYELTKRG